MRKYSTPAVLTVDSVKAREVGGGSVVVTFRACVALGLLTKSNKGKYNSTASDNGSNGTGSLTVDAGSISFVIVAGGDGPSNTATHKMAEGTSMRKEVTMCLGKKVPANSAFAVGSQLAQAVRADVAYNLGVQVLYCALFPLYACPRLFALN